MVQIRLKSLFEIPARRLTQIDWSEDLYLHHTLGLGDMIHFNGMVRYLLQHMDPDRSIHVFCKDRNSAMTQWMYRDEPRIVLELLRTRERESDGVQRVLKEQRTRNWMCIGHRAMRPLQKRYPHVFFDQLFYLQAGIPYEVRYSHCYWLRDYAQEERLAAKLAPQGDYAFVHDDATRGYIVSTAGIGLPIVRNDISESIFHMGLLLERATEVHCMESSIRCMIESLDMKNTRLYYHNFRYPERPLGDATRQEWHQIEYPNSTR